MFQFNVPVQADRQELPLTSGRVSLLVLYRSSIDQMRPTHMREGNLLYSAYLVKCQSHLKIPCRYSQNNV